MDISSIRNVGLNDRIEDHSIAYRILRWLQDNPHQARNTNIAQIARAYPEMGVSEGYIRVVLNRLLKENKLIRGNGKRRANFRINYFAAGIPRELLDSAPEEDKAHIKRVIDEVEERQSMGEPCTLGNEGEITTPIEITPREEVEQISDSPVEIKKTKKGTTINISITINL